MAINPILFNGYLVRSILDDRKTQTRRPVKPQPPASPRIGMVNGSYCGAPNLWLCDGAVAECREKIGVTQWKPNYVAGDILYVRETWRVGAWCGQKQAIAVDYQADGYSRQELLHVPNKEMFERLVQQSIDQAIAKGCEDEDGNFRWEVGKAPTKWRRSIHMPRWAARIFLEVTNARVQQAWDMRTEEAKAEGFKDWYGFLKAWKEIYGVDIDVFDGENPFLWVYEFKRCEQPENFLEAA